MGYTFLRIRSHQSTMPTRQAIKTQAGSFAQRRGRRILLSLFFFIVCVLAVDALVGDQGLVATMRARKQYDQLASDLARLRNENASLREEARRLREDPSAIEAIARRELGLMSPGERLFIIKDVPPPSKK
jgi:cell division protein FtsB